MVSEQPNEANDNFFTHFSYEAWAPGKRVAEVQPHEQLKGVKRKLLKFRKCSDDGLSTRVRCMCFEGDCEGAEALGHARILLSIEHISHTRRMTNDAPHLIVALPSCRAQLYPKVPQSVERSS